jgi:hypothetical protein
MQKQIANGKLQFKKVTNDLRKWFNLHPSTKTQKWEKEAFATFAGKDDQPFDQNDDHKPCGQKRPSTPNYKGRGRGKYKGKGGRYTETLSTLVCPMCDQTHTLQKCYYAFPNLAFKGFIPRPHLQTQATEKIANDTDLQKQIKSIGRSNGSNSSKQPKLSQTPAPVPAEED